MKNKRLILNPALLALTIIMLFLACDHSPLPNPVIHAGIAKISGRIMAYSQKPGEEAPIVTLIVPNAVTGENSTFETKLKEDGSFNFEVPVESSPAILCFYTSLFGNNNVSIPVTPKDVNKVSVTCEKDGKLKVTCENILKWTSEDMVNSGTMFGHFINGGDNVPVYSMPPEEFSQLAIDSLIPKRFKRSFNDSILSESAKMILNDECRIYYLKGALLSYTIYMTTNYRNFGPENGTESFKLFPTPRSYYAFLKQFDLNNPNYLYNAWYAVVFHRLLENETLNIPKIDETPVDKWLTEVKPKLSDLVGINDGLFYDMLVANSYSMQLNDELKPLSDKQKENIQQYFKSKGFAGVLLRKNEEIVRMDNEKKQFKLEIVTTPEVPKEQLMDAIISKYKGKTVVVDFWATWCQPCMAAMQDIRKVKSELIGKDVVFVYITNISSPKKLWEQKVKQIGGEHYYLTNEQWEYVMQSQDFSGIPTYLLYDADSKLKNKMTGFPGMVKMQEIIEGLLPQKTKI